MTSNTNLNDLFDDAVAAGVLTKGTSSMLTGHLGAVVVAGAAGTAAEDIVATDVTLMTILIDASSSIQWSNLEDAVRDGQNELINAFAGSKEKDAILMALWTFNTDIKVLHSYVSVADAKRLDKKNYQGSGYTRLYDGWCDALMANVAYAQQLKDSGTPVRSIVVVITDGSDTKSKRRASECKKLSEDLLSSEQFVLAFVGVGTETNFKRVARNMGIPEGSILVQKDATPKAIRNIFQMVSRSAIRASQGQIQPGANAGFFRP